MIVAARLQEGQVPVDGRRPIGIRSAGQLFHQLCGGREARRVLIHVVRRAVEVRDPRPRHASEIVVVERVAVIRLEQVEVDLAEAVGGHGPPFFDQPVRLQLVVRKQHLRVEGRNDAVDRVLQQHDPLALVGGARQHVIEEQRFAQRRRHLGHENRVAGIDERLVRMREARVHRMPHLVRQREDGVERVVVIEQHVGMHAVDGRRVRPASLSRIFVHVDPLTRQHLANRLLVRGAQRRHRRRQPLEHIVVRVFPIEVDQRKRGVVRVVGVESEHALAQPVVPAQRLGAGLRRLDEVLDDRGWNVVAVQRRLERRRISAGSRVKPIALKHGVVQRRVRVGVRFVQFVQLAIRQSAIRLVAIRGEDGAVLAVGQRHVGAGREPDGRILDVGRRQRRVGVVRRRREAARERQQMLAFVVEHVLLLTIEILEGEPIHREIAVVRHPLLDCWKRDAQQLRIEPGARLVQLGEQDLHLLTLCVDLIVTLILVVPE